MHKLLLIGILSFSSIFANIDLIEIYRNNGINEVEKLINKELTNKRYWEEHLKNKNTKNGYYESLSHIIMCNKNIKDIKVYDTKENNIIFSSKVLTGQINGSKKIEGDLKTPIGAYKLVAKLTNVDDFYGPFALQSNYPNEFDKSQNKTGHGIWIHGVPFKESRNPYTKGCIALNNTQLENLDSSIDIHNSMLIISENNDIDVNKNDIAIILSEIFAWKEAWKKSNINKYLSFYSKDFKRKDKSTLKKFANHKKRLFKRKEKKIIKLSNINIIPYPNDLNKNIYQIIMHEYYKTNNYKFIGKKILYVELVNNKMKILFE